MRAAISIGSARITPRIRTRARREARRNRTVACSCSEAGIPFMRGSRRQQAARSVGGHQRQLLLHDIIIMCMYTPTEVPEIKQSWKGPSVSYCAGSFREYIIVCSCITDYNKMCPFTLAFHNCRWFTHTAFIFSMVCT